LLKAACKKYGRNLHTDIYVPWISGKGDIILGDNVIVDGFLSLSFAARYTSNPTLTIGDNTGLGHNCTITVAKEVNIGRYCRIASDVFIFDSSGHPSDPERRQRGEPADAEEVRPVTICDNVWIGRRAIIHPGVTIGEGSIVSAGAVVMTDVPDYTIVAGNPARKIASLRSV
jgi:acetyltransferase-like isoleucine patch superfamily enzyme